ncbi:MAG: hypothetical protein AAFR98_10700, partial [Pseudomonadota bacterium]
MAMGISKWIVTLVFVLFSLNLFGDTLPLAANEHSSIDQAIDQAESVNSADSLPEVDLKDFERFVDLLAVCSYHGACRDLELYASGFDGEHLSCGDALVERLGAQEERQKLFDANLAEIDLFLRSKDIFVEPEDLASQITEAIIGQMPWENRSLLGYQLGRILEASSTDYFNTLRILLANPSSDKIS